MLPDDDLMLPGNLEAKVAFFEDHPEVGFVHSSFRYVDAKALPFGPVTNWTQLEKDTVQPGWQFIGQSVAQGGMVCVSSVMMRSDLVTDERFDSADGPYCDMALWLRLASKADVGFLTEGLSGFRVHTGSASSGFKTHRNLFGRTIATQKHADALLRAHGRFVEGQDLDDETRANLRKLLDQSDSQLRLSIRVNSMLPSPALRVVKRAIRWGRPNRLYSALSLYSAYQPEPVETEGVTE